MTHLTPDEHIDALDDALSGERLEHWRGCAACRAETEQLRALLRDVPAREVPEPSPLFWTQFRRRVQDAIADPGRPAAAADWRSLLLRWQVLAPIAAVALVAVAFLLLAPHHAHHVRPHATDAANASAILDGRGNNPLDDTFDDGSWRLVVDLVDDLDLGAAPQDGLMATPGLADRALGDLRPAEREELLRLLRAELGDPES